MSPRVLQIRSLPNPMEQDGGNGARTHEPNLRELTAELDGVRALFMEMFKSLHSLIDERDRLYKERDDSRRVSVDAALIAAKEQTAASFVASEKAIVKAEEAQRAYNVQHNDLARKMDEQNKATIPRIEAERRMQDLEKSINDVRNTLSAGGGVSEGGRRLKDESRANIALGLSLLAALISLGGILTVVVRSLGAR